MISTKAARRLLHVASAALLIALAMLSAVTGAGLPAPAAARAATPAPTAPPACTPDTLVTTREGPVCGLTAGGVTSYSGIDYAAPPAGALRWAPPAPVTPWTQTLEATAPAKPCPQAGGATDEDCLNVTVRVPAGTGAAARLPVIVQIHGGGFRSGVPKDITHVVANSHVIGVEVNYRLGVFGFLALDSLGAHAGDYGIQDQQAALRWVQRNIARFGGNPHDVTIQGASAGGASVCDNVVSPTAAGLFQNGISESGFYNSAVGPNQVWQRGDCKTELPTEAQAQQAGARFAARIGCPGGDVLACLRALPAQTLSDAAGTGIAPDSPTMAPIVNGTTLPMSPGKAFATGHVNHVRLVIGIERDEINGGTLTGPTVATTPQQYRDLIQTKYGPLAKTVMALYPLARYGTPFLAFRHVVADADSVCPALANNQRASRFLPIYAYEDDHPAPPQLSGQPTTIASGAYHVAVNRFFFWDSAGTLDANDQAMADQVQAQWTGFARTGNPTGPGTPLWTRFTRANPQVMSLVPAGDSVLLDVATVQAQHNCGFWDAVTATPSH